jgi:hypothetical protein
MTRRPHVGGALHSAFLARTHVDADDRRRYHVRKDATPGEACSTLWKLRELLVVPRLKRSRGRARFSALYPIDRFPICRSDIPNAAPLRPGCIKLPGYHHSSRREKATFLMFTRIHGSLRPCRVWLSANPYPEKEKAGSIRGGTGSGGQSSQQTNAMKN